MMNEINTLFGIVLFLALAFFLRHRQRHRHDARRQQVAGQALDGCATLLGLVRALQQHRGLSTGWLSGERGFERPMLERRQSIERHLQELAKTAALETAMPRPCFTHQNLTLYRFQWRELAEDLPKLGVDEGINRHGLMIARALDWLATLGEARIGLAMSDRVTAGLVANYAERLPVLAEYLGQLRALGSGAAARGQCSPVTRVRLRYLASRSELLLKESLAASQDARSGATAKAVNALLAVVRQEMLGAKTVRIQTSAYFETATQAIDAVYGWVEACGEALRDELAAGGSLTGLATAD